MNNKGFTLVEVMAIVVVLVGIFLVSYPILTNTAKIDEEKKYNNMVEDLCTAGKTYMYSNMDKYPELSVKNSVIEIKVSTLISYGNVDKNLLNPKSDVSVALDTLIYTILEDFSLDCIYKEGY